MLCLHGFTDTWRTWELILPALEQRHDVLAVTLAGGWALGDHSAQDTLAHFATMQDLLRTAAPHADTIASSPEGRRRATECIAANSSTSPPI